MKKLITILTVMIVLVGAVFATDPTGAQINITATIDAVQPLFKLSTLTGVAANKSAEEAGEVDAALSDANITALTTLNGVATVTFDIKQYNLSRTITPYTLDVAATDLVILKDSNGTSLYADFDTALTSAKATQRFVLANGSATPTISAGSNAQPAAYATNHVKGENPQAQAEAHKLALTYDGVAVDGQTAAKQIGTFSVSWNATVDAQAGAYQAEIVLTVTSSN